SALGKGESAAGGGLWTRVRLSCREVLPEQPFELAAVGVLDVLRVAVRLERRDGIELLIDADGACARRADDLRCDLVDAVRAGVEAEVLQRLRVDAAVLLLGAPVPDTNDGV